MTHLLDSYQDFYTTVPDSIGDPMKAQFLIIVSALCFGVVKSNVEASQIEDE